MLSNPDPQPGPPRALFSYWFYRGEREAAYLRDLPMSVSMFSDSGGFSAYTQGAEITVDEYAAWLTGIGLDRFDAIANLDVIGDAPATLRNHDELETRLGRRVLPVVHFGAPVAALDAYANAGHSYIALGGLVAQSARRMPWILQCFRWAQTAGVVFHGFGVTTWRELAALPWYSADSSSWGAAYRYGVISIFVGDKFLRVPTGRGRKQREEGDIFTNGLAPLLRRRGFDPDVLGASWDRYAAAAIAGDSYRRAETWLRARHGVVRRADTGDDGLRIYLADSVMHNMSPGLGLGSILQRQGAAK